jgi:hypothetical protein
MTPFLDEILVEKLRAADAEWMRKASYEGCPNCGQRLSELPPEANVYPHQTGACKKYGREK